MCSPKIPEIVISCGAGFGTCDYRLAEPIFAQRSRLHVRYSALVVPLSVRQGMALRYQPMSFRSSIRVLQIVACFAVVSLATRAHARADDAAPTNEVPPPDAELQANTAQPKAASVASLTRSKVPLRMGGVFAIGHGLQSCTQEYCEYLDDDDVPHSLGVGQSFFIEGGGRPIPWIEISGGFTFASLRANSTEFEEEEEETTDFRDFEQYVLAWYSVHSMVRAYPLARSRFDPFVGMGLGFTQFAGWTHGFEEISDYHYVDLFTRANLLLTAGLDVYLHRRIVLGVFFRYNLGLGGRICSWSDSWSNECISK